MGVCHERQDDPEPAPHTAMSCPSCGRTTRAGARFCGECGRPLASRCPACGTECEPGTKFCEACGVPLVAAAPERAVARKVVTIVFADLIGSTSLHERLDPESTRRVMDHYYDVVSGPIARTSSWASS